MNATLLNNIKSTLVDKSDNESFALLKRLEGNSSTRPGLINWINHGSTLELRELCSTFGDYMVSMKHRNSVNGLDSAKHLVLNGELTISPGLAKLAIKEGLTLHADYSKGIIKSASNDRMRAIAITPSSYDDGEVENLPFCYCVTKSFSEKLKVITQASKDLGLALLEFKDVDSEMSQDCVDRIRFNFKNNEVSDIIFDLDGSHDSMSLGIDYNLFHSSNFNKNNAVSLTDTRVSIVKWLSTSEEVTEQLEIFRTSTVIRNEINPSFDDQAPSSPSL